MQSKTGHRFIAKPERIRAVRPVIGPVEALIATFNEVADELAEAEAELADAAMLTTVSDRLASAKDSAEAALAMLRQSAKDAETNDDGEAGRVIAQCGAASFRWANRLTRSRVCARTSSGIG
jgi:hypothetical protein